MDKTNPTKEDLKNLPIEKLGESQAILAMLARTTKNICSDCLTEIDESGCMCDAFLSAEIF